MGLASLVVLVLIGAAACDDEGASSTGAEAEPAGAGTDADDGADETDGLALECEREGYACTWEEVDGDAAAASFALGAELDELVRDGWDPDGIAAALEARDDVADARIGATAAWFRLDGGRPVWVLGDDALVADTAAAARGATAAGDASTATTATAAVAPAATPTAGPATAAATPAGTATPASTPRDPAPRAVVGTDHASKSALVLSAYEWDGLHWAADEAAALLEGTRGYEGGVTHLANAQRGDQTVSPEQFRGWEAYDVVYVATHGAQLCDEGGCQTILGLGIPGVDTDDPDHPDAVAMLEDAGYADTPGVGIAFERGHAVVAIEGDWLASTYAGGLDDTLVFVQACSSARAGDLTTGLVGSDSVFFGWSDTAFASDAGPAAERLFTELTERGITSSDAFAELEADGLHVSQGDHEREGDFLPGDTIYRWEDGELQRQEPDPDTVEVDAVLEHHVGGDDLRIREVVELQHPETSSPLADGETVTLGADEDGAPTLPVRIQVDGVLPGEEADFEVDLTVNGIGIPEPWTLADASAELVDDETYVITDDVTLPGDVAQAETLDLVATAALPEGGESIDDAEVEPAQLELAVHSDMTIELSGAGQFSATLEGTIPLAPDSDTGELAGDPPPDWATYTYVDSHCPGGSGVLSTTSDVEVPRAVVDPDAGTAEVDLRWVEERGGPALDCDGSGALAGGAVWSEHEAFVTTYVVAYDGSYFGVEGDVPRQILDFVGNETVRFTDWEPGSGDVLFEHTIAGAGSSDGAAADAQVEMQLRHAPLADD